MPRNKPFRVAMIPASTDGVNYYRMAAWAFEMRKYRNTVVELLWFKYEIDRTRPHPWQDDFTNRSMSYNILGMTVGEYIRHCIDRACEAADVVIWHPVYYDYIFEFFLQMQHKHQTPFLVEVDDNLIDVPPWNEAYKSFEKGSSFRRVGLDCLRNADGLIVSTDHLQGVYAGLNDNIWVAPNSLDFQGDRKFIGWDRVSVKKHNDLRIGWIGGRTHFDDLMEVAAPVAEVLRRNPGVRLTMVNSAFQRSCELLNRPNPFAGIPGVLYADRSVAINRYAPFMSSFGFDIGLAPLVDCDFNRSKSNLRWLEYSALKIPTIASKVWPFEKSITHGVNGILVDGNDPKEWAKWIEFLIRNPSHREALGREAHKTVKQYFNVRRNAAAYMRLLKEITGVSSSGETQGKEMVAA